MSLQAFSPSLALSVLYKNRDNAKMYKEALEMARRREEDLNLSTDRDGNAIPWNEVIIKELQEDGSYSPKPKIFRLNTNDYTG